MEYCSEPACLNLIQRSSDLIFEDETVHEFVIGDADPCLVFFSARSKSVVVLSNSALTFLVSFLKPEFCNNLLISPRPLAKPLSGDMQRYTRHSSFRGRFASVEPTENWYVKK